MRESLQLLNKVQQELLGKAYQEDIWKWHMIYSLCGQMALVSLWDAGEDSDDTTDGCISIRHFKSGSHRFVMPIRLCGFRESLRCVWKN